MYKTIYVRLTTPTTRTWHWMSESCWRRRSGPNSSAAMCNAPDARQAFQADGSGTPEEYHDENELERQRQIHDSLITRGLQIITDSYLDIVDRRRRSEHSGRTAVAGRPELQGPRRRHQHQRLRPRHHGALGVGAVKDSVIGGVTERVVRRVRASDIFVIKNTLP